MESLKEAVYSRKMHITELMNIGFQLFCKNIKIILLGVLWLGLPISLLLTIIQFRLMGFYDILAMSPTQLASNTHSTTAGTNAAGTDISIIGNGD